MPDQNNFRLCEGVVTAIVQKDGDSLKLSRAVLDHYHGGPPSTMRLDTSSGKGEPKLVVPRHSVVGEFFADGKVDQSLWDQMAPCLPAKRALELFQEAGFDPVTIEEIMASSTNGFFDIRLKPEYQNVGTQEVGADYAKRIIEDREDASPLNWGSTVVHVYHPMGLNFEPYVKGFKNAWTDENTRVFLLHMGDMANVTPRS
jgi:hypothetical protein